MCVFKLENKIASEGGNVLCIFNPRISTSLKRSQRRLSVRKWLSKRQQLLLRHIPYRFVTFRFTVDEQQRMQRTAFNALNISSNAALLLDAVVKGYRKNVLCNRHRLLYLFCVARLVSMHWSPKTAYQQRKQRVTADYCQSLNARFRRNFGCSISACFQCYCYLCHF